MSTEDGHPPGPPWAGLRTHSKVTRTCKICTARSPPTQCLVTPSQPCPHHPQLWLPMESGVKLLLSYLVLLHWHGSYQPPVLRSHLFEIRNWQMKLNSVVMPHTGCNHTGPTLGLLVGGGVRRGFPNPDPRPRRFEKQAGTTPWGCILSPSLFNLYAEYIMQNVGLDEAQAKVKIARKNINKLKYADDTTLSAESKEELKSLLMKVKDESEKAGLKLNIQKTKIMASGPIISWQINGETMTDFFFLGSRITADGDCSHEIKRPLLLGRKAMTNLSSVQSLSHVRLFAIPWTAAHQVSLSVTNSRSLLKLMSIELVMPSNQLIFCGPLLLPPSIFPSIMVFSNESALCIRWPKYWSFTFNISLSSEHTGLISFRMDWLDLLAVQGTLKSLLQHHNSKASILRRAAFFTVQLSHPSVTTGKTIASTRWTFAGKVMSLLFNMLSRLVINFLPRSKHLLISWLQLPSAVILEPPQK